MADLADPPADRWVHRPGGRPGRRVPRHRSDRRPDPRARALPDGGQGSGGARRRVARRCGRPDRRRPPAARGPETIGDTIVAATDAVERYADEARASAARRPPATSAKTSWPSWSGRDGRSAWSSTGHRSWPPRAVARASSRRRPSIKRGYLNLLHAREAIARHALEAQDLESRRRAPEGRTPVPPESVADHTI